MSRADPECFPYNQMSGNIVCTDCFDDLDLKNWLVQNGKSGHCNYCDTENTYSCDLTSIAEYIHARLSEFYGRAVEQLPYETREGGYQGWHVNTFELLFDIVGLDLPNDETGNLQLDLVAEVDAGVDEPWCEYDWLLAEYNDSLLYSWKEFEYAITCKRRFFFMQIGQQELYHPDTRSVAQFLAELGELVDRFDLVSTIEAGAALYRARPCEVKDPHISAESLGPPPSEQATQSNRMNPPGIPMFYGASDKLLAIAEVGSNKSVSIGRFEITQSIRIIDLFDLADVPSFFSTARRKDIQGLKFLHDFSKIITRPIARDDRTHIEYIPTQVITEYFRDFKFKGGLVNGVRYRSATGVAGSNTVLFATQENLVTKEHPASSSRWLRLTNAELEKVK